MFRHLFALLILVHGSIHLMGFLKAFDLVRIEELELSIGRAAGMGWLVSALLFVAAALLFWAGHEAWPFVSLAGAAVSMVLILFSWQAAKYGMIPNLLILTIAWMWFGMHRMDIANRNELHELLATRNHYEADAGKMNHMTDSLPEAVRNWLRQSGADFSTEVSAIKVSQKLQMKLKPSQKQWFEAQAEQYALVHQPAFIWKVKLNVSPLIHIQGRDLFASGKAEMHIRANGLVDLVKATGPATADGSLIRYLGELVWYPWAALSDHISWQEIDNQNAVATIRIHDMQASARFTFDEKGRFLMLSAMRLMNENDPQRYEWVTEAYEWQRFDGIDLPSRVRVSWILPEGKWTWLDVQITGLERNPDGFVNDIF
ncbi:MAG: hypothetical protein IPM52_13620 [Bacteroidetes bacterium]|nr:hypothetical protein [Bacteroidota bacterium]